MAALTIVLLVILAALLRIAVCTWRGISGVDFGIGVGPSIWHWRIRAGVVHLRLLPLGDSAKLPMEMVEEEPDAIQEVCKVQIRDQRMIAAATLVPPLIVLLCLLPLVDLHWIIGRMGEEVAALISPAHGSNLVNGAMWLTVWTPTACAASAILFLFVNALPSPLTTMGFLLGIDKYAWMNRGWVKAILCLYPLAVVILVLLAVLI